MLTAFDMNENITIIRLIVRLSFLFIPLGYTNIHLMMSSLLKKVILSHGVVRACVAVHLSVTRKPEVVIYGSVAALVL